MNIYFIMMFTGSFLAAFSQILLKQSANSAHKSFIKEYINLRVILAYFFLASSLLINVYAYRGVPYKYAPVFAAATYVFSLALSVIILKENVKDKIIGNTIVLLGMIIYLL